MPVRLKVVVIDDWQDVAREAPAIQDLSSNVDIEIHTDRMADRQQFIGYLNGTAVVVPFPRTYAVRCQFAGRATRAAPDRPNRRGLGAHRRRSRLRRLKPGAVLLNTARGALIPDADLVQALRQGAIAGAGLDVLEEEPLPGDSPLRSMDNVVLTPHVGWTTKETQERYLADVAVNIRDFMAGRFERVINPDALKVRDSHQGGVRT